MKNAKIQSLRVKKKAIYSAMAYEVYLRHKDRDLSPEAFRDFFSARKHCRIEGDECIYENPDTGVGFYFSYMADEKKKAPNVFSDGVYRAVLRVEYGQPAFFFVEALYEVYDLVEKEGFVAYDPQIGGSSGREFEDRKLFESWTACNIEAVCEYMLSLGSEMDDVPVMPYDTLKKMWEWNYELDRLRGELDRKMQVPAIQCIDFGGEDLTAVLWKEGGPIAIPYVDIVVFARRRASGKTDKEELEYDFCAVDYEAVKPLIEKYSESSFANAYLLEYDELPEEIEKFIAQQDPGVEFMFMDMCDVLEYEVAEEALFPGEGGLGEEG